MSQYATFFNSINGDRKYDADSMSEWLRPFFATGVFNGTLQVTSGAGMSVKVAEGFVNISGRTRHFDAPTSLTLMGASGTLNRIDTVVARMDTSARNIELSVVTGSYASAPSPTAPVRSGTITELVLAQIYVKAGATAIAQSDITDSRSDTSVCGWVTSTVTEMDYSQFAAQFADYFNKFKTGNQADFDAWFKAMKDQLTTDAAGKLQTEVDTLKSDVTAVDSALDAFRDSVVDDYTTAMAETAAKTPMGCKSAQGLVKAVMLLAHPIGSLYQSTQATSPADLFGGEWQKLPDGYLIKTGSNYAITGSNTTSSTALTVDQMPSHDHGAVSLRGNFKIPSNVVTNGYYNTVAGSTSGVISVVDVDAVQAYVNNASVTDSYHHLTDIVVDASHTHAQNGGDKGHTHTIDPLSYTFYTWVRVS